MRNTNMIGSNMTVSKLIKSRITMNVSGVNCETRCRSRWEDTNVGDEKRG